MHPSPRVRIPLAMMNRHGLIAGATGTGKTKTLQLLTEQLSAQGVPVFVADIKGDLSGLAASGESNARSTSGRPASGGTGSRRGAGGVREPDRQTRCPAPRHGVGSFGPLLLGKVLALNETQTSVLSLVFKFCDDQGLPLLDFDRSPGGAQVPRQRRGQAGARGIRRNVAGDGRRAAPEDGRAGGAGGGGLLRRAGIRRAGTSSTSPATGAAWSPAWNCPTSRTSRDSSPPS